MKSVIILFFALSLSFIPSLHAEEILTWQQCVDEAKTAHPDLYSAQAVLQQTEADKSITSSQQFPQLSVGFSGGQRGSTERSVGSSSSFGYSLTAKQLLYDGQKTSKLVASDSEAINVARYRYREVSASVRFVLRSAFAELLKAQELIGLTKEIAERRQKNVRMINLRYQAGREHIGSLRKAEADMARSEFEVSQAQRGLDFARSKLASAMGRDDRMQFAVKGTYSSSKDDSVKPDFVRLARNTPWFLQLESSRKAGRYDLDAAKSTFSPELYLAASVGRNGFDRWPPDEVDWNAGVDISVPIYGGGSGRAKVARAMAVLSQRNADEKSGYLELLDLLEERWKQFADARQYVMVQKKYLDASVERSTIADVQYSNGLISFDDWVIIEDSLVSAKKAFLNAGADLLIAEASWIQATGGGLDDR
ncbi:MAG: TolC family protein [Chlorobium sp.]|uniref:TolC family protein n=1 Tax=Chlorobium sp. TaxID=1095 RepID=UPI001E0D9BA3|nr:TolC family protein [Chlorobium sp.]MBN1279571.1 TolC family protein [Chlorobiaceae bacterium]MCF8215268.1 TolC family protein [Chlorobium sp.]MCF8270104.1 TolC family protein [Chlorobium sp.]MCF8286474.1 TolC family protein [Chlorobium sp.]MCF8290073.1 TolC family protein [Chlorobium sp.]